MYHINDQVVHPGHGACTIEAIEERSWNGESKSFYTLHPMTEPKTTLMIPVDNAESIGIRSLIPPVEARSLLDSMRGLETDWIKDSNSRKQTYGALIRQGDLTEISKVCKALTVRETTTKLSGADKDLLRKVQIKLLSEIALSLGESFETTVEKVNELLKDCDQDDLPDQNVS